MCGRWIVYNPTFRATPIFIYTKYEALNLQVTVTLFKQVSPYPSIRFLGAPPCVSRDILGVKHGAGQNLCLQWQKNYVSVRMESRVWIYGTW